MSQLRDLLPCALDGELATPCPVVPVLFTQTNEPIAWICNLCQRIWQVNHGATTPRPKHR